MKKQRPRAARREAQRAALRGPAHRPRGFYGTPSALDALEGLRQFCLSCAGVSRHEYEYDDIGRPELNLEPFLTSLGRAR